MVTTSMFLVLGYCYLEMNMVIGKRHLVLGIVE